MPTRPVSNATLLGFMAEMREMNNRVLNKLDSMDERIALGRTDIEVIKTENRNRDEQVKEIHERNMKWNGANSAVGIVLAAYMALHKLGLV